MAVRIASDTTLGAYRTMFRAVAGRADLEVLPDGLGGLDPALAARAAAVEGVAAAVPVVQAPAALRRPGGNLPVLLLGVDPAADRAARTLSVVEGRVLEADGEALLEAGFARRHGWRLGDGVDVLAPGAGAPLRLVGLVAGEGAALFNGGAVVLVPLPTAQRLTALGDRVGGVQVVLAPGAPLGRVREALAAAMPPGTSVAEPGARAALSRDSLMSTELGLATVSVMSLVAGAFIILNTFLMNVAERRRQVGILRSLGATRGQVVGLFLREAAVLGVAGTALGAATGWAIAGVLVGGVERLLAVDVPGLVVGPQPFLLALALGPALSLAAAWAPSRAAARRPPLEGIRAERGVAREDRSRRGVWVGVGLLATTAVAEVGFVRGWLSGAWVAPFMAAALAGFVLAFPLVQPLLLRAAAPLARALFGAAGALAVRQVERRPHRTAVTVGVLFLSVAVGIGTGHTLLNNVEEVRGWYDRTIVEDLFVRAAMPDTGLASSSTLPEALGAELEALPGVARVDRVRFAPVTVDGRFAVMLAKSFSPPLPGGLPLEVVDGTRAEAQAGLARGEAVLATALAARLGVGPGGAVSVATPEGPRTMRVAATATEYTVGGMAVYVDFDAARALLGFRGVDAYPVTALEGRAAEAEAAVRGLAERRGLLVQSRSELWRAVDGMVAGVVDLLWMLLVLVFVVASLGVVNTLAMSVVEQTREIGLLRAAGAPRSFVARGILAQAFVVGVLSLVPGALAGLALAWLQNQATYPLLGLHVVFRPVVWLVLGCLGLALLTAAVSAVLPAARAARLKVVRALQYE